MLLIVFGIREPVIHRADTARRLSWAEVKVFPRAFWVVVGIAALMTLARFSEGFLLLRAQSVGLRMTLVPLVFIAMNVVYSASPYPVGWLSDRVGR